MQNTLAEFSAFDPGSAVALSGSRFHHQTAGALFISSLVNQKYNDPIGKVKFYGRIIQTEYQQKILTGC